MPKKRNTRSTTDEVLGVYISVIGSSASISRMEPDRRHPHGNSSTSISIEGNLDKPVVGRAKVLLTVFPDRDGGTDVGGAIGVNATHWNVVVDLREPHFSHALALVAGNGIAYCYLAVRGLKRGVARVVSASFSSYPVPSQVDDFLA